MDSPEAVVYPNAEGHATQVEPLTVFGVWISHYSSADFSYLLWYSSTVVLTLDHPLGIADSAETWLLEKQSNPPAKP